MTDAPTDAPMVVNFSGDRSRFRLVILASQRAREIMDGASTVVKSQYTRATSVAIEEVLSGQLEVVYGDEAKHAQAEARRFHNEMKNRRLALRRDRDISSDIRKDMSIYLEEPAALKGMSIDAEESSTESHGSDAPEGGFVDGDDG